MYLILLYYPDVGVDTLDALRMKYDPMVHFIRPHVPVVFPVPESDWSTAVFEHVTTIVGRRRPFAIRLHGFEKSPDHWLFLKLEAGESDFVQLFEAMYTGPLARFRRGDVEFVPHVGLGLFVKKSARYDMSATPQAADLDEKRYGEALREAEAMQIDLRCDVSRLDLVEIGDKVLDWARGKKSDFPSSEVARTRRRFHLATGV